MRTTTNSFVLVLAALFALLVNFGCSDIAVNPLADEFDPGVNGIQDVKASEPFNYTVDLASQQTLKVEGINGVVNVESVSGTNVVTISGEKVVGSESYSDAKENLKNVRVEIDELYNELVVKTVQPKHTDGRNYNVNYTITIPSHLNIDVKNVNGKISGEVFVPINGTVDLHLSNGSIELNILLIGIPSICKTSSKIGILVLDHLAITKSTSFPFNFILIEKKSVIFKGF